ncbi:uncharacterized protein I303_106134 [Kwoniella dejecticola CBS 10117]|uniref:Uncharacterized protein n=1 Tax=Kwoniella dejecticola CBS 10117 TaxID=1296121 RepID=A0AAJ8MIK9_9TREE
MFCIPPHLCEEVFSPRHDLPSTGTHTSIDLMEGPRDTRSQVLDKKQLDRLSVKPCIDEKQSEWDRVPPRVRDYGGLLPVYEKPGTVSLLSSARINSVHRPFLNL